MLFLQPNDFKINGSNEFGLNNEDGFMLVFFTSDTCEICDRLKPQYNKLSKQIQGCVFSYMDVEQENMKIRQIANRGGVSIDYVPMILLFANDTLVGSFELDESGNHFSETLRDWIIKTTELVLQSIQDPPKQTCSPDDTYCVNPIGRSKPTKRAFNYKNIETAYK